MGSKNSSKTQHMIRPVTQLLLHPAGPQLCVAQLHVPEEVSPAPNPNGPLRNEDIFVLIVDHSYSMDTYSTKLVQEVFPLLLAKLDVSSEEEVLLVIFSDSADGYWVKAGELVNFRLPYQGYTYMSPVWSVLERMLLGDGLDSQGMRANRKIRPSALRILAISDGEVHDQERTMAAALALAPKLQQHFEDGIQACAVRLSTGGGHADTRALASVLQLNHGEVGGDSSSTGGAAPVALVDLLAREPAVWTSMPDTLAAVLPSFAGAARWRLSLSIGGASGNHDQAVFRKEPWQSPDKHLVVRTGKSTFWVSVSASEVFSHASDFTSAVEGDVLFKLVNMTTSRGKSEDEVLPVEVVMKPRLTQTGLSLLLSDKIEHFVSHVKLMKVIDNEGARTQIQQTLDFFRTLEAGCAVDNPDNQDTATILGPGPSLTVGNKQRTTESDTKHPQFMKNNTLKTRAKFLQRSLQSNLRSVTTLLENIANDDKVRLLNQHQQADYLREVGTGVAARGLAKRAQKCGLDFDATIRKEVANMARHLDDLVAELEEEAVLPQPRSAGDGGRAAEDMGGMGVGVLAGSSAVDPANGTTNFSPSDLEKIVQRGTENHNESSVSMATTLEGIQALVEWYIDHPDDFAQQPVANLLKVFNVVGLPVSAKIGDYPDPMTYRVDEIFVSNSSLLSVADITTGEMLDLGGMNGGAAGAGAGVVSTSGDCSRGMSVAGFGQAKAVNVIPVFEDIRIQRFLIKHAPNTLELLCSVGMRRVLAVVPKTFSYSVVAGIWRIVSDLAMFPAKRTSLIVSLLQKMLLCYEESLGGEFDYLLPHLVTPEAMGHKAETSFFLNHNGVTNMIGPLWTMVREGIGREEDLWAFRLQKMGRPRPQAHTTTQENPSNVSTPTEQNWHFPAILRALFTYETYQAVRYYCKRARSNLTDPSSVASLNHDLAEKLLNISERQTPLPNLFERPDFGVPDHNTAFAPNASFLHDLKSEFSHIAPLAIVPSLFVALRNPSDAEVLETVRNLPIVSMDPVHHPHGTKAISEALQISYPFDEFFVYNVIEGLLYQSKQARVESNKSKRLDLVDKTVGEAVCEEFIRSRLHTDWEQRLKKLVIGKEQRILKEELVEMLARSGSVMEFEDLLKHGLSRGSMKVWSGADGASAPVSGSSEGGVGGIAVLEIDHEEIMPSDQTSEKVGAKNVPVSRYFLDTAASSGIADLRDQLTAQRCHGDAEAARVLGEKLAVFLTAENEAGETIWNRGNVYPNLELKQRITTAMRSHQKHSKILSPIADRIDRVFEKKPSHIYRTSKDGMALRNRHGHGTDFWSYFAYGFPSLEKFVEAVPVETWQTYQREHAGCCGVAKSLARRALGGV